MAGTRADLSRSDEGRERWLGRPRTGASTRRPSRRCCGGACSSAWRRRSTRSIRRRRSGARGTGRPWPCSGRSGTWRATAASGGGCRSAPPCRRAAGRKRRPTAAIIDTQSVRTGPQRGPRGYDAHKKVKGRKRVLMVDVGGDPLGVRVVPADVQDRDALAALAPDLAAHPSLRLAWTDLGFAAERCGEFLARHGVIQELVGTPGRRGFAVEPRRWKIEQTFGCLQRYRRLRVDDEASTASSRHMTILASVFMTGMRLERMLQA